MRLVQAGAAGFAWTTDRRLRVTSFEGASLDRAALASARLAGRTLHRVLRGCAEPDRARRAARAAVEGRRVTCTLAFGEARFRGFFAPRTAAAQEGAGTPVVGTLGFAVRTGAPPAPARDGGDSGASELARELDACAWALFAHAAEGRDKAGRWESNEAELAGILDLARRLVGIAERLAPAAPISGRPERPAAGAAPARVLVVADDGPLGRLVERAVVRACAELGARVEAVDRTGSTVRLTSREPLALAVLDASGDPRATLAVLERLRERRDRPGALLVGVEPRAELSFELAGAERVTLLPRGAEPEDLVRAVRAALRGEKG